ncbi:hypothetical protein [Streptomyces sp. NPDC047974]|uniref:hypothetical protein n=1 Tax=Streptomyces sp. NPDC047974 TaxID=3154343 RepID=UPI0033FCA01E
MSATQNTMSGDDWIGESRHSFCVRFALDLQRRHVEALAAGDPVEADKCESMGRYWLQDTLNWRTGEPKHIVSDEEAARLRAEEDERKEAEEAAKHLAEVRKRLEPRANASAFRPYSGGLPTLGRGHR